MSLTRALAMPGHSGGLVLGNRSNDRTIDQSLSRALCVHEALSDLDIAKLAHGMQITDLGKTPVWHIRMNDGSDTADLGATAMSVVRSSGADPMPTGAVPGWAYVTSNRPPTVAKPTIDGTPQAGTASTATLGTADTDVSVACRWCQWNWRWRDDRVVHPCVRGRGKGAHGSR